MQFADRGVFIAGPHAAVIVSAEKGNVAMLARTHLKRHFNDSAFPLSEAMACLS